MPGFQVSKGLPRPTQQADCLAPLLADVEEFYRRCNPDRENLCLYGAPPPTRPAAIQAWQLPVSCTKAFGCFRAGETDGTWNVNLPAEEVPPELPEPCLGINFARDGMARKDWLALVAVHSDSWLYAVAFYYGAKLDAASRYRLYIRFWLSA